MREDINHVMLDHLVPFVKACCPEFLNTLEQACALFKGPYTLNRRETLIEEGDRAYNVFFVVKGTVGRINSANRLIFLSSGPGFTLNEDVWTRRSEFSDDRFVSMNELTYYKLSTNDFDAFIDVPGAYNLIQLASWRYLDERRSRLTELLHSSAEDRLSAFLNRHPGIMQWLTKEEVASYLGMSRANFYRLTN